MSAQLAPVAGGRVPRGESAYLGSATATSHGEIVVQVKQRIKGNVFRYGDNCDVKILEPKLGSNNATVSLEEGQDFAFSPNLLQGDQPLAWELIAGIGKGNYAMG